MSKELMLRVQGGEGRLNPGQNNSMPAQPNLMGKEEKGRATLLSGKGRQLLQQSFGAVLDSKTQKRRREKKGVKQGCAP